MVSLIDPRGELVVSRRRNAGGEHARPSTSSSTMAVISREALLARLGVRPRNKRRVCAAARAAALLRWYLSASAGEHAKFRRNINIKKLTRPRSAHLDRYPRSKSTRFFALLARDGETAAWHEPNERRRGPWLRPPIVASLYCRLILTIKMWRCQTSSIFNETDHRLAAMRGEEKSPMRPLASVARRSPSWWSATGRPMICGIMRAIARFCRCREMNEVVVAMSTSASASWPMADARRPAIRRS